jgi:hypothetical protein
MSDATEVGNIFTVPAGGGTPVQLTTGGEYNSAPTVSNDWTLAFMYQSPAGKVSIVLQWLGSTQVAAGPAGYEPGFAPGNGGIKAPARFPIPVGSFSCPRLQFFGVRGSGETAQDGDGYGTTVQTLERKLAALVPGLSAAPVSYPAVAVGYATQDYGTAYRDSVSAGENALQTALIVLWSRCPDTDVVLAGYSQGAQVAGDVADALRPGERAKVAAVVLFGDPRFNPRQPKVDAAGTGYSSKLSGIYQFVDKRMRAVPGDLVARTRSYCLKGDVICNFSLANLAACLAHRSKCPHLHYVSKGLSAKAAAWAATEWHDLAAAAEPRGGSIDLRRTDRRRRSFPRVHAGA